MGAAYSISSSASTNDTANSSPGNNDANASLFTNHGFSKLESDHLTCLRRMVCKERARQLRQVQQGGNRDGGCVATSQFLTLVWKCSHLLALHADVAGPLSLTSTVQEIEAELVQKCPSQMIMAHKRCLQLDSIICSSGIGNNDSCCYESLNNSLEQAIFHGTPKNNASPDPSQSSLSSERNEKEIDEHFLEFVSNMIWRHGRGHNQKNTLDFLWGICQNDNQCNNTHGVNGVNGTTTSANGGNDALVAKDVINFCFQSAIMMHYMLQDHAFNINGSVLDGDPEGRETATLIEPRDALAEDTMIQSMTESLLEYASHHRTDQTFGGYGGGGDGFSTDSSNGNASKPVEGTISKTEFSEWQRKILPDLFTCSIVQLFQVLFFPPELSQQDTMSLGAKISQPQWIFQQYDQPFFPILHSSKELSSRNNSSAIIPVSSPVFGNNVLKNSDDSAPATALLSPAIFTFASISATKFGGKWYRIFDGSEDGWTFHQLEHSIIGYQGPTLLVIRASSKNSDHRTGTVTFGAYTSSKWEKNKRDFFGSSDCFLFQLQPTLRVLKSLPKMGTRGGHYMYFYNGTNANTGNPSKKDDMAKGLGFGGTVRNPRLFVDLNLEECRVSSQDTSFEEGHLGFAPSSDPFSSSFTPSGNASSSSSTLHIDSLEIYAVGDEDTLKRGFQAQHQHRDIADAALRNARTVDKAAFLGDLRNGVVETKAFAHRGQVDGRAHGCLKGEEDGKPNGL